MKMYLIYCLWFLPHAFGYTPYISNGITATRGQFPFQVALVKRESILGSFSYRPFCGGALISEQFVLTAAHCVESKSMSSFEVIGGALTVIDNFRVIRRAEKIRIHPRWDTNRIFNDVALIKLSSPMNGVYTKPIRLPIFKSTPTKGSVAIISGYGRVRGEIPTSEKSTLAYTKMEVIDQTECPTSYDPQFELCTKGCKAGCGTCVGDSGGPLTDPEGRAIIGIVSNGRGACGSANKITIFTKVSGYVDWIVEQMKLM